MHVRLKFDSRSLRAERESWKVNREKGGTWLFMYNDAEMNIRLFVFSFLSLSFSDSIGIFEGEMIKKYEN